MKIIFEVSGIELITTKQNIGTFDEYIKEKFKSMLKDYEYVETIQKELVYGQYDAWWIIFEEKVKP